MAAYLSPRWARGRPLVKKTGLESLPSQLADFTFLRQFSTHNGSNDDGGGGNKPGAHRTSSTRDPCNSYRTDMIGSIHMDNTRIRSPDSRSRKSYIGNPGNQIQFQRPQFPLRLERQNVARGRKSIHLPPMQLREAFSCSSPFVFVVLRGTKAPNYGLPRRRRMRVSLYNIIGCGQSRGSQKMAKTRAVLTGNW